MIKLDKRLSSILDDIKGGLIADIGCDHGKLVIMALISGKAEVVIASDISASSLSKTKLLANDFNLENKVDCRVGDGFEKIQEDLDTAIIAGLGGYEIREILLGDVPQIKRLILCPHQNPAIARMTLNQIGYSAVKDYVVKEGKKFYQIIVAEKGEVTYAESELRFGLNVPNTPDYYEMLNNRKAIIEERFTGRDIPSGEMQDEYQEIIRCLKLAK